MVCAKFKLSFYCRTKPQKTMHPLLKPLFLVAIGLITSSMSQGTERDCAYSNADWIQFSPTNPAPGDTVRIKALSIDSALTDLLLETEEGTHPLLAHSADGPPYSLDAETHVPLSGSPRIVALRGGETVACRVIQGASGRTDSPHEWTQAMEAFYASWIAQLFDGPPEQELSFRSLEPVLRDPERNFLHNSLGLNEDIRLPATPDCADLPYFLRAYFAWKMELPVAYRACDRGTSGRPPHCGSPTLDDRFSSTSISAQGFTQFSRKLFDTVHSGSARTAISDESTDFYPLEISRSSLWPGAVYADPYGHTLIIAKWVAPKEGRPGILLAADAQPDNSVTRKRFWEGNFLFADIAGAGPGFKAFRPILRDDGRLQLASNRQLSAGAPAGRFSLEQEHLPADDFYAAMERAINPSGLKAMDAYESKLSALIEQIQTRVTAVENGETYARQHRGASISMPTGPAIFETTGPWEDYASPSRDMRLLIALNVVSKFPDLIRRHPELFNLESGSAESSAEEISRHHAERIQQVSFQYQRSDGSPFTLTLAQLFERRGSLEVGYNPNDCAERRWGAISGTEEYQTCTRQAPQDQAARMEQYRSWFRNTQRPTR
jgi:hypothetical protein